MRIDAVTLDPVKDHGLREVDTLHIYASPQSLRLLAEFLLRTADDLETPASFGHRHITDWLLEQWPDASPEVIVLASKS